MLLVQYGLRFQSELFSSELMVIPNRLVHPVDFSVRIVEGVSTTHFEDQVMPSQSWAYVVYVGEPDRGLTHHERVCWRRNHPFRYVGLKIIDRRSHQEYVVSPARHYRIWFDPLVSVLFEK